MSETAIMKRIRVAVCGVPGARVVRNNTGVDVARGVRYGLGTGGADLVGIVHGRPFALEVKRPGQKPSPDQERWLAAFRRLGGYASVVTSVEEALSAVAEVPRA